MNRRQLARKLTACLLCEAFALVALAGALVLFGVPNAGVQWGALIAVVASAHGVYRQHEAARELVGELRAVTA